MTFPQNQPFRPYFRYINPQRNRDRLADLRTIYAQVGRVNRRQYDVAVRRELIQRIGGRRHGRTDVVPFDVVPDPRGDDVLAVPGELLVRAEVARGQRGRDQRGAYELEETPVETFPERLVRWSAPGMDGARLPSLAGALTARGVPAALHYVAPTGVVWKGIGGPESSAGPGPVRPPRRDRQPVRVAVIDTGITAQQRTDSWLTDVVRTAGADGNVDPLDALPTPPDGLLDLSAGHGTFAAGAVQQVAPDAELAVYQALDSDGVGSEVKVAEMMVRAVTEGAQILNLSLGIETVDDQPPAALQVALEIIQEFEAGPGGREVVVVAAAGNLGHERPCWPAAFDGVTAVAALTQDLEPADWSSRGHWVDCSTIGEGVRSTFVEGTESPLVDPDPDTFGPDAWALWSGTSFAAPQIAGAIALIAQEEEVGPREALSRLLAGRPEIPGYGRAVEILPAT